MSETGVFTSVHKSEHSGEHFFLSFRSPHGGAQEATLGCMLAYGAVSICSSRDSKATPGSFSRAYSLSYSCIKSSWKVFKSVNLLSPTRQRVYVASASKHLRTTLQTDTLSVIRWLTNKWNHRTPNRRFDRSKIIKVSYIMTFYVIIAFLAMTIRME